MTLMKSSCSQDHLKKEAVSSVAAVLLHLWRCPAVAAGFIDFMVGPKVRRLPKSMDLYHLEKIA